MREPPAGDQGDAGAFLAEVPLFATLEPEALAELSRATEAVAVTGGAWLFRQGDADDGLYVVRSGRIEVVAEQPTPTTVRVLGPGDALGELAVFRAGRRSAGARALRDSELLHITRARFSHLIDECPGFGAALLKLLADKVADAGPVPRGPAPRRVLSVVAPPGRGAAAADLARALAVSLRRFGSSAALRAADAGGDPVTWGRAVDRCEAEVDWVVLWDDEADDPAVAVPGSWRGFCFRQADRVVFLTDPDAPAPGHVPSAPAVIHLAVVSGRGRPLPPPWAATALSPHAHHVVDAALDGPSVDRLARRLAGRSVGLVLSGGGARGFAHIGVLERLHDAGVAIDRVGGVSIGAFIGALVAQGLDAGRLEDVCRTELVDRRPFADYTIPRNSIIRGLRGERLFQRLFGDDHFEEQPRSMFCVSADLVSARAVVHRSGPIAPAVTASMSIPGYAPPRLTPEGLLVDGGILNNLPVDEMAAQEEGPVIAVDVMQRPPGRGNREGVVQRLPGIMETLARSTVLASWGHSQVNRTLADLVISPEVGPVGLMEWRAINQAIDAGRRAADAALADGWGG
ncbi:MAG: patatin-like phospholipase family protein [Actinomycetota bacterium]|nr:patatin-like phospholipase family protein [Actinomycetota bacterium]